MEYDIIKLTDLLSINNLVIPNYQRPYKWSTQNASQLFDDILNASQSQLSEYRIGTIVLHEDSRYLNVVDGQQRLLTLTLLNDIITSQSGEGKIKPSNQRSAIYQNYFVMKRLWESLQTSEQDKYKDYFDEKCTVIKIVIKHEAQAFQFFDSQNSRGKALEVHDLLKAYHLREMKDEVEAEKLELINAWESIDSNELIKLFSGDLYQIKNWMHGREALNYSRESREMFKGVKVNSQYNFTQFQKSAHLFIEKFNREHYSELLGIAALNQFQLDQKIISGRRFFEYVLHYLHLKNEVTKIVGERLPASVAPQHGELQGTIYIRELYISLLMCYYDHFGLHNRHIAIENLFMKYCYHLRLRLYSVSMKSINKYALGRHEYNKDINFFNIIVHASEPREIESIVLDDLKYVDIQSRYQDERYKDLRKALEVSGDGQ